MPFNNFCYKARWNTEAIFLFMYTHYPVIIFCIHAKNSDIKVWVVNFNFRTCFCYYQHSFIAHDVLKNSGKTIHLLSDSSFCVLNFLLPTCRPDLVEVYRTYERLIRHGLDIFLQQFYISRTVILARTLLCYSQIL